MPRAEREDCIERPFAVCKLIGVGYGIYNRSLCTATQFCGEGKGKDVYDPPWHVIDLIVIVTWCVISKFPLSPTSCFDSSFPPPSLSPRPPAPACFTFQANRVVVHSVWLTVPIQFSVYLHSTAHMLAISRLL